MRISLLASLRLQTPRFEDSATVNQKVPRPPPTANGAAAIYLTPRKKLLLLHLFMLGRNSAPFAVFLQFNLSSYQLTIFARPVVGPLALVAGNLYELVL